MNLSEFGGRYRITRLTPRIKFSQLQLVFAAVAIIMMLTWGVYAVLWTFPNDQGSTINAVLGGEYSSGYSSVYCCNYGPIIPPGADDQFIIDFAASLRGRNRGACLLPTRPDFDSGSFAWPTSRCATSPIDRY